MSCRQILAAKSVEELVGEWGCGALSAEQRHEHCLAVSERPRTVTVLLDPALEHVTLRSL